MTQQNDTSRKWAYPKSRREHITDNYHGMEVPDPYRWLEDSDSEDTRKWIHQQNQLTFSFLESIPARKRIRERLTALWNYERYGVPFREGGKYFYSRNDGLQNQGVLYVAESLEAEPRILLDPNILSEDGTVALTSYSVSRDGGLLAYGLSSAGSDWTEWRIRDVHSGNDLEDHLRWIKFSGASWTEDHAGFFYSRYPEPGGNEIEETNYFQKLCYHRVGTPQSRDLLIHERPDEKEIGFSGVVTEDADYLVIHCWKGTDPVNAIAYQDLSSLENPVVDLIPNFEAEFVYVGNDGPLFWFRTNWNAPRGRLIAVDIRKPDKGEWKEIIPESSDTLESVSLVNACFVAVYLRDARTRVGLFGIQGDSLREIELPGLGTAAGFYGRKYHTETFYAYSSFITPTTIYRYDFHTEKSNIFKGPQVDFDSREYEEEQIFYAGKDGTRIPMFLVYRKDLKRAGNAPTYLYGYGGFNVPVTPAFGPGLLVWLEMGGILAVANIRGGGEYGEEWHRAGAGANKQNVFDDFICAAEWLIAQGYTSSRRLAIGGGSNGGLLVAACMIQRPELFAAVLPSVGVLDMLRFHRFTIGWAWIDDYGSSEKEEEFRILYAYSPLHNVKAGVRYPAVLMTTADHDDRVVPAHSFKFTAALQAAQAGDAPILIRIDVKAGHGMGKPTMKTIEEIADKWTFLFQILDMETMQFLP